MADVNGRLGSQVILRYCVAWVVSNGLVMTGAVGGRLLRSIASWVSVLFHLKVLVWPVAL